jgi:hypothetical protein
MSLVFKVARLRQELGLTTEMSIVSAVSTMAHLLDVPEVTPEGSHISLPVMVSKLYGVMGWVGEAGGTQMDCDGPENLPSPCSDAFTPIVQRESMPVSARIACYVKSKRVCACVVLCRYHGSIFRSYYHEAVIRGTNREYFDSTNVRDRASGKCSMFAACMCPLCKGLPVWAHACSHPTLEALSCSL